MDDVARLTDLLQRSGRVVLGYSGGVDSALLAVVGARALAPGSFLAVIGQSDSYPASQHTQAMAIADAFAVPVREIRTEELSDPRYLRNAADRCYFCKSELWTRMAALARAEAFDTVIDGTNADDLEEHRPGRAAGLERGIRSPLAELGMTKAAVRAASRALGIPSWDAPASPCLSSRIRYGLNITPERLAQVEQAEAALRSLGVTGDLRVRHLGFRARIEVAPAEFEVVDRQWGEIVDRLRAIGFDAVERDAAGYRRGSLLGLA